MQTQVVPTMTFSYDATNPAIHSNAAMPTTLITRFQKATDTPTLPDSKPMTPQSLTFTPSLILNNSQHLVTDLWCSMILDQHVVKIDNLQKNVQQL